jgi:DNA modification methylase
MTQNLLHGDCLEVLKTLPDCSVDSVVTDPPAGIGFMGKDWDHHKGGRDQWIAWLASILKECNRVLKPGGHALVWSIPRTSHWTGMACEHAGFEVRDQISHIFGSGFPKSLNVSKAIDKEAGVEREVIGPNKFSHLNGKENLHCYGVATRPDETKSSTDLAKQWDGWGTSLKPSREDWWLVRKPLSESTVAKNVVKHGTGALNIDGSRIGTGDRRMCGTTDKSGETSIVLGARVETRTDIGRWPSHTLFDEDAARQLDLQSGFLLPSRFFYCAKSSKSERNKGCEGLPAVKLQDFADGTKRKLVAQAESAKNPNLPRQNFHPTVKSIKLMEYLIKLITPPNGTVLDPFMGSGSTGVAAKNLGMNFIGIEQNEEYIEIAKKRCIND